MGRQIIVLLLGWALGLGWLGYAQRSTPSNAEVWARFQRDKEPHDFDALILRGAFGTEGIPELSDWLEGNILWKPRVIGLHPLEAKGLMEKAERSPPKKT